MNWQIVTLAVTAFVTVCDGFFHPKGYAIPGYAPRARVIPQGSIRLPFAAALGVAFVPASARGSRPIQ